MRQRIARLTSGLLNPFIVCFIAIVFVVLHVSGSIADALKWVALALVFSVLPVFIYVICQVKRKKLHSIFPESQGQRRVIYLLASIIAAIGCGVMWWLDAPEMLVVSFIAGLATIIVFMTVNIYWKISLHSAFISAAAMILTLVYGAKAAWVFVLLVPVAWARLELKMHTPAQLIAGTLLAAGIIFGVTWGFGTTG